MQFSLALLLVGSVVAAQPVSQPARTDDEVWLLAKQADVAKAYVIYDRRFRFGRHSAEAAKRYQELTGTMLRPPAPPAPPPTVPTVTSLASPVVQVDACSKAILSYGAGNPITPDIRDLAEVRKDNRLSKWRAWLATHEASVCKSFAERFVIMREARIKDEEVVPRFGPLAAAAYRRSVITSDDYPSAALRRDEQGTVKVAFDVAPDGWVEQCRIIQSSGSEALDHETCRLITRRMRYDPARDAGGRAMASKDETAVSWRIPQQKAQ